MEDEKKVNYNGRIVLKFIIRMLKEMEKNDCTERRKIPWKKMCNFVFKVKHVH